MTIMMPRITAINCLALLVCFPIFFNFIKGQHEIIECTVIDGDVNIHLRLQRTEQLLINENLPVWIARHHRGQRHDGSVELQLIPNLIKNNIGDFILYQDKEKSAAFVLFVRTQTLTGVVDTRYAITALPLHHCRHGAHLGRGYVENLNCDSLNHQEHLKDLRHVMHGNINSLINHNEPTQFGDSDWTTTLYLEIMVFNLYDLTKIAKAASPDNYLAIIVTQYIIYFNAADMLISKLSINDIKINLNLAGIIIEDEDNVFHFYKPYVGDVRFIDVDHAYKPILDMFSRNLDTFPQDSFDYFFISTSNAMWSTEAKRSIEGLSYEPNMYERRSDPTCIRSWAGVGVRFACGYEYITAAHEIVHLLGVKHDPVNKGFCGGITQCYGVMQKLNKYCPDCIKWSAESVEDLKRYVKYNRDHCFLLNIPRSLSPYGSLMMTLTPLDQCRCYGFDPRTSIYGPGNLNTIPWSDCGQSLFCDRYPNALVVPPPIDGTPCSHNGVCWNRMCRHISNGPQNIRMIGT